MTGFDTEGTFVSPAGATTAYSGQVIASATWNTINATYAAALTEVGQNQIIRTPTTLSSAGSDYTIAPADRFIFVTANTPRLVLPACAAKLCPVTIYGASTAIFNTNPSTIVPNGVETINGSATKVLSAAYESITLMPMASGGYTADDVISGSSNVTSVALALPNIFTISGSPVTSTGTLTGSLATQLPSLVFASSGIGATVVPSFRSLVAGDIPALSYVSNVGLSLPSIFNTSGTPVTSTGTLTGSLATQNPNLVWASDSSGATAAPTFRALAVADLPSGITVSKGGTGAATFVAFSPVFGGTTSTGALQSGSAGTSGQVLTSNGATAVPTFQTLSGTGSVTNVGLALPNIFTISGSPVTTAGTLTGSLATQLPNLVWASDGSGSTAAPTFRSLVVADLPSGITVAKGGTGAATFVAYSPIFGGTTSTGTLQSGSLGSAGQILTSNGATAVPTFQAAAGGGGITSVVFYTTTQTITIPAATTKASITLLGAGGGAKGDGCSNFGIGGAGGYLQKYLSGLTAGQTLELTIGAGGTNAPASGGTTSLASGSETITTLTCNGGTGANALNAGAGGTATNGDINVPGKTGATTTGVLVSDADSQPYGSSILNATASGFGAGGLSNSATGRAGAPGLCIIVWSP